MFDVNKTESMTSGKRTTRLVGEDEEEGVKLKKIHRRKKQP